MAQDRGCEDDITACDIHGDYAYLLSHHQASRFKVLRVDLRTGDLAKSTVAVPPGDEVITSINAAADALYVQKLDGGLGRLWRLPYDGREATEIPQPFEGAIEEIETNPTESGAFVRLASWTKPPTYFHYDPKSQSLADTKIIPPSPADFSGMTSEEIKVKSSDGTLVPLSVVHRRDLKLDGSHPTLLHGYGSYGITLDPHFDPTTLAWLERGGVLRQLMCGVAAKTAKTGTMRGAKLPSSTPSPTSSLAPSTWSPRATRLPLT